MIAPILGLHHITAIASQPQPNIDFYVGLLGLRMVKQTVNFDDPSAYHLYYGDTQGTPGTIVTFFYWPHIPRGRVGAGQATGFSFSVPSVAFWAGRLQRHGVAFTQTTQFGLATLNLQDPDGIPVQLVEATSDTRPGHASTHIPAASAIRGFYTVPLTLSHPGPTVQLLTDVFGYRVVETAPNHQRLCVGDAMPGHFVDVIAAPQGPVGIMGAGTIHHVAWRVADDSAHAATGDALTAAEFALSPIMDRQYFHSIYFRELGGIICEIATDNPGFAVDEPANSLGSSLMLPPQFESARAQILQRLVKLNPAQSYT